MKRNHLLIAAGLCFLACTTAKAGNVTYIFTDPQGTPLAETDANGVITATFDYKPFGAQAMGAAPDGPAYTGHVNDSDTSLIYMQARYYDPAIGMFLSTDPAPADPGNTFELERYGYANLNPYKYTDPDGRESSDCNSDNCHQKEARPPPPPPPCSAECMRMRNTADHGIQPALQRVGTAIANRSSFTAEGAAAFGAGGALSATKQVGESDDSVKGSFVIGEGAMAAATYNFKIWSTIKETNDGIVFKGDPSSYFKAKLGVGLALGLEVVTDPHGAMDVSIQIGGGIGEEAIYKPPVTVGGNYNIH